MLASVASAELPDCSVTVAEAYPIAYLVVPYLVGIYYLPCLFLLLNTIVIAYIFIAIYNVST